eukprot:scaffold10614_cov71-Phaeocystis_antarctica.AAC.1
MHHRLSSMAQCSWACATSTLTTAAKSFSELKICLREGVASGAGASAAAQCALISVTARSTTAFKC